MRRVAGTFALAIGLVLAVALPVAADTTPRWDVVIDVDTDGSFHVTETITQNFEVSRRGIYRYIPVTERLADDGLVELPDGTADDWFQRIRISDIEVRSSTAPDATKVERPNRHDSGGVLSIRIGEEDTFITSEHTYTISYRVEGALLPLDDGTTILRWDAVGDGWQQYIEAASLQVNGPGILPGSVCVAGVSAEAQGCVIKGSGPSLTFAVDQLGSFTPFSVQVPFDADVVPASDPILQRRWTLAGALYGDGLVWPLFLLMLIAGLGGVGRLMYRAGRDRETRGDVTVDGRTDTTQQYIGDARPRPLFQPRPVPIEFTPPDDLRPGELGLIIDERVDPVDIAATIVDLAVRGHLVIEEDVTKRLWWTNTDWTLRRTDKDTAGLLSYERFLFDGLFDGRTEVAVSDLKGTFSQEYGKSERALYEQGRKRGWFAGRPDKVRASWALAGAGAFVVSLGLTALALYFTRVALATLPLVIAGTTLLIGHRNMPRRTPKGSQLLTRTLGFREFIETAETDRARFAEQEHLFVDFLPYAIVFGATEKWARAFADLAILTAGTGLGGWYVWHAGSHGFDARGFSSGLSDFATSVGTATVTAPPSSSGGGGGGFSGGGGFGGGGGGSW